VQSFIAVPVDWLSLEVVEDTPAPDMRQKADCARPHPEAGWCFVEPGITD
jgi:hypothetical protein